MKWCWERVFLRKLRIEVAGALNPHIMITGKSGSGKSNACKQLLQQLCSIGAHFLVLDPHGEYVEATSSLGARAYDASISSINIFDLDGLGERERISEITSMFRRIFRLGEVQAYTLHKCIAYTYKICAQRGRTPSIHDLVYTIKVFKKHAMRSEASVLESLERRLVVILGERFTRNVSVGNLLRSRSIFSLESLRTAEAQAVYMEGMLKKLYTAMLGSGRNSRRFYIVIDEAEKLQEGSAIARLVAEGRKYNVGIIAASQRAKALDKEIRSNAATIIAFAQHEPEEQNYVANLIAGGNENNRFIEVRRALRELRTGQALVHDERSRNPKIVNCARFEVKEKDPSYEIIVLARNAISKKELVEKLCRKGFTEETVMERVRELIKTRELGCHIVTDPNYAGAWYISSHKNSPEHDVMVNLISRHLSRLGIDNVVYNSSYGPDVIAYKDGKKIAIEYETGSKAGGDTARMLKTRQGKYSRTIVVSQDSCTEAYEPE